MPLFAYSGFVYAELEEKPTEVPHSIQVNCDAVVHIDCGNTPSALMGGNHQLWVVFEQKGQVYFSTSDDFGESYSSPIAVNKQPEKIYTNGENRPKITRGKQGEIYVSWTKKTEGRYTGEIRFSRSVDGGKVFQEPYTVNNDGLLTSHRFDSLQVAESGLVYLAWLDKRDQVEVKSRGGSYSGAALYFAVSSDSGATFSKNYKVADNSCECCRIAIAAHKEDEVAVLWRHIFPDSVRDHASAVLKADGGSAYGRATYDNWQIKACPHHGPDITAAVANSDKNKSRYHIVWFSNGDDHKGVYYGLQDFQTGSQSQIYSVDSSASASHPQVARSGQNLYVAWKLFDGDVTHIRLIASKDQGLTWIDKGVLLNTTGNSDHPQLIEFEEGVYLGWHTFEEGYRVKAI